MSTDTTLPFVPLEKYNWSLSHFSTLPYNPIVYALLSSFFAISLWLVLDLLIQIHLKFKKYTGLYYWCILLTTLGIGMHAIAFILKLFVAKFSLDARGLSGNQNIGRSLGTTALAKAGWVLNTSGFSMVLWSRLSLVVQDRRVLRATLIVIIANALLLHTPIIVFSFGLSSSRPTSWLVPMSRMERIQVIGFTLQDLFLSTFYTVTSARLLNIRFTTQRRNLFIALVFAQVFGFVADGVMVVLDWKDMFTLKASLHPFIYAVKLKIEFLVLNQLGAVVGSRGEGFVEWAEEVGAAAEKMNGGDPVWPGQKEEFEEKEDDACLRCQVLNNKRKKWSAGTESLMTASVNSSSPRTVSLTAPLRRESLGSLDIGQAHPEIRDRGLEDLERQYLGQYR